MANQAVNSLQDQAIEEQDLALNSGENLQTDAEIASLFIEMRGSSGQDLTQLSQYLGADIGVLQALEQGNVDHLPSWEVSSPIITKYAKLLGLDPLPILRRVALHIQARQSAKVKTPAPQTVERKTAEASTPQKQEEIAIHTQKITQENSVANPQPSDDSANVVKAETITEIPKDSPVLDEAIQDVAPVSSGDNPVQPDVQEPISKTDAVSGRPTKSIELAANSVAYRPVGEKNEEGVKQTIARPVTQPPVSSAPPLQEQEVMPSDQGIGTSYQEDTKPSKQGMNASLLMPTLDTRLSEQDSLSDHFSLKTPQPISDSPSHPRGSLSSAGLSSGAVLADGSRAEPKLFADKPPQTQEDSVLRADRRDFPELDGKKMESTILNDPFSTPEKSGPSLFSWLVILASLVACAYIGWFIYSEPKLGEILWDKLPFLTSFSVLMDNSLINS